MGCRWQARSQQEEGATEVTAATLSREWECDVCQVEPGVKALPVPGVPGKTAVYGQRCLDANAHPYDVLVEATAAHGGLGEASGWWRSIVERSCAHLGKTIEEFNEDVARARR